MRSIEPCFCGDPECRRCFGAQSDSRLEPANAWLILRRTPHVSSVDGMCVWWRSDGNGYTYKLDEAGHYSEAKARDLAGERDLPVRLADAVGASIIVVRRGTLGVAGETKVCV